MDSGCSKHMTEDISKFSHLSPRKSGHVTYGDKGFKVVFDEKCCLVESMHDKQVRFIGKRINNIYMLDLNEISSSIQ